MAIQEFSEFRFNLTDYKYLPEIIAELLPADQTESIWSRFNNEPRFKALNSCTLGHLREDVLLDSGWDEDIQRRVRALNLEVRAANLEDVVSKEERQPRYPWVTGFNQGIHIDGIVGGYREVERLRYQANQLLGDLSPITPEDYQKLAKDIVDQVK